MSKQTLLNIIFLTFALIWFAGWWVTQNTVNANEEILTLQQEKYQLEKEIQEEKDWWWVDEDAKSECVESWANHQAVREKNNDKRRERIQEIEERLGLLMQSQLQ